MRLTLCTIALNEAPLIGGMLDSAADVVDDIVIGIDDRTTDRTAEIAQDHSARTIPFTWRDDFSTARNAILEHAASDWLLVLDPDERLTPEGAAVIRDLRDRIDTLPAVDGFQFVRAELDLAGTCHAMNRTTARLFRNLPTIRYHGIVHEEPLSTGPKPAAWTLVDGLVGIAHVGYCPELWVGRQKHALYLRLLEQRVAANPADAYAQVKLAQERAMNAAGIVQG